MPPYRTIPSKEEPYFATPDHSWERGLNEPTNGLSSDGSKSLILRLAESPPSEVGKLGGVLPLA